MIHLSTQNSINADNICSSINYFFSFLHKRLLKCLCTRILELAHKDSHDNLTSTHRSSIYTYNNPSYTSPSINQLHLMRKYLVLAIKYIYAKRLKVITISLCLQLQHKLSSAPIFSIYTKIFFILTADCQKKLQVTKVKVPPYPPGGNVGR